MNNDNLLNDDEAQLLVSLLSSGGEKSLLQRALVTIGNKAAFTGNQVITAAWRISAVHCICVQDSSEVADGFG